MTEIQGQATPITQVIEKTAQLEEALQANAEVIGSDIVAQHIEVVRGWVSALEAIELNNDNDPSVVQERCDEIGDLIDDLLWGLSPGRNSEYKVVRFQRSIAFTPQGAIVKKIRALSGKKQTAEDTDIELAA